MNLAIAASYAPHACPRCNGTQLRLEWGHYRCVRCGHSWLLLA